MKASKFFKFFGRFGGVITPVPKITFDLNDEQIELYFAANGNVKWRFCKGEKMKIEEPKIDMIKPIRQPSLFQPEIGEILSGSEFIQKKMTEEFDISEWNYFSACIGNNNPWKSLKIIGIDTTELEKVFEYRCPWTNNIYYHFLPTVVIAKDVTFYRKGSLKSDYHDHWFLGKDFFVNDKSIFHLYPIQQSMLGHGYTTCTLPSDGSGKFVRVLIELENKDLLFGYCWEWYNK